jgi:ribosome-associated protein
LLRAGHHNSSAQRSYFDAVDRLRTPGGTPIDPAALRYEFARGGGPGGQHVNTSATKATVVLDVDRGLPARAAARVRERHGSTMRATSSVHRSQWKNRTAALERLLRRIDEALDEQPERRSTRVPAREKRRRRSDKERRSRRLAERRPPPD